MDGASGNLPPAGAPAPALNPEGEKPVERVEWGDPSTSGPGPSATRARRDQTQPASGRRHGALSVPGGGGGPPATSPPPALGTYPQRRGQRGAGTPPPLGPQQRRGRGEQGLCARGETHAVAGAWGRWGGGRVGGGAGDPAPPRPAAEGPARAPTLSCGASPGVSRVRASVPPVRTGASVAMGRALAKAPMR